MAARTLDIPRRTVTLEDGTELTADEIVVATGSHAVVPSWTTLGPRVVALRTLGDAQHLGTLLRTSHRLAVVGTGFLGLEVAAAARSLGVADVVVSGPLEPMVDRGRRDGERPAARPARASTTWSSTSAAPVVEAVGDDTGATVRFADRTTRSDAAVVALGARPNVAWLAGSGLTIVPGVVVDARGRAAPGVHAVGEVAAWPDREGRCRRVDHRQTAGEQARTVAADLLGDVDPLALVPYWWSDQYDVRVQAYGVTGSGREEQWLAGDRDAPMFALAQRDGDLVGGVVGWNAARATREGRALVATPTPWPYRAA